VIYQLLPSDCTAPWMSLHSSIPHRTEWQKPEESNQKHITRLLILRQWVEQRLAMHAVDDGSEEETKQYQPPQYFAAE